MLRVIKSKTKEEWLKTRIIGGTDVSAIMGYNKHKNAIDVYMRLVKHKEEKIKTNEAMERGIAFEPLIRDSFALDYKDKYKVIAPPKHGNWVFYRTERPYLTASLDSKLVRLSDNAKGVLEIKTCDIRKADIANDWKNGTLPMNYYCQCLTYASVMKCKFVILRARLRYFKYDGTLDYVETRDYYIDCEEKANDIKKLEQAVDYFYKNSIVEKHIPTVKICA